MRRKFLLKVMILSLLFVAMGGGDLFAQSVTEVSDAEGLKSALTKSGTVKLTGDIEVETTIGVPYVTVTLDLNGHSIKAKSDNIYPINNDGILTITDSKGNGVIEGLGLSSGFDNNTNAKGPRSAGAELFINGGTFRNLNSETGAAVYVHQGEATINGGSFYGRNIAIMSANGTVEINGGFIDGYESAIVSSASVKIKGATKISGQCRTENGGSIFIAPDVTVTYYQARIGNANNWTSYETLEDAIQAAQSEDEVYVFAGTYDVPSVKAGITINGEVDEDGKTKVLLEGTLSGTLENVTLKNLHIKGGNAQRWAYAKGDLYFENVTFEATSVYAIHFDGITEGANLLYKNCTIIGWAAMSGSPVSCIFENCTIKDNGTYGVIRTYFDATIENCTFDIRNANPDDVYQDGIHAVSGADLVVDGCTNIIGDNGETGDMKDIVNVSGSSTVNVDGELIQNPVRVGENYYATIQDAIVAAAPNGTVELLADVTVDKWIMFSERLSIGNGNIITKEINGLTIDGDGHTLTINSIESAGNGNRLFYDATELNIKDLTIQCVDAAANQGGIGLTSGTISNVNFIGGGPAILPGTGEITVTGCTFKTNGTSIYYEEARDNLVVNGNTFENPDGVNVILLRGNTEFTNNIIESGRTVNVVSGSPVVSGNDFKDVRFKVYNAAEATISNNTINNLEFNDESVVYSTFGENTLSDDAQAALDAMIVAKIGEVKYCSLQKAINAAQNGETITLLRDCGENVTITQKADVKFTIDGAQQTMTGAITVDGKSATIMSAGVTIKNVKFNANNITTDAAINLGVYGDNNTRYTCNVTVEKCTFTGTGQTTAAVKSYTGGDKNLTITNCNVDNTMHSLAQVAGVDNVTITNTVVNSKNGINVNSSKGDIVIKECVIDVTGYAFRTGVNDNDPVQPKINITESTLKSAEEMAVEIRGNVADGIDLTMTRNIVTVAEGQSHITGTNAKSKVNADANYWGEGLTGPVVAEGSAPVVVNSYYTDAALTNLVRNEIGSIYAFVLSDRIFGEVTTNAIESIKIEIIGKDGSVIGTSSLEDLSYATGFNKQLTWRINLGADDSGSWAMAWHEGAPSINNMPAKVKLYVDAKEGDAAVAEAEIKYTANGDGESPVFAAKTNAEGKINSFIACTGEYNLNNAANKLVSASADGDNIAILTAGKYDVPTGKDLTITGAVDGVVFDNIGAKNMGGANVTFNNVTFDYYPNVNYTGLQHSGNLVYNNCTFEGQPFLYGTSETFNNCTFNQNSSDAYNVWTYGAAQVAFNECTFNSAGKSVLIYKEETPGFVANVSVDKCEFNASSAVVGKAAIEMDSSLIGGINLTIDSEDTPEEDRTTATGFGEGNASGNSLWNNKKGNNDDANNDITVVVAGVTVLEPVYVAKIGEEKHRTLQEAIDAATAGGNTINLLADVNENVTVIQKEGFNILIDGNKAENANYQFDGIINIYGNARHTGTETLTIQNIDFYTEVSNTNAYYFINALENGSVTVGNTTYNKQYAHNVTVKGCNFTTSEEDTDNQIVGIGLRQTYNIVVYKCTAKHIFSLMWGTAVDGLELNQVTLEYATEGITLAGASKGVEIKNSKIVSPSYGIRADGPGSDFTIENSTLEAKVPVVVRKVNEDSKPSFTFKGTNTITESNPTSYWFVAGAGDAYQGNENEPLPETAGQVSVTLNDTGLRYEDVYGNYYELAGEGTADNPYTIANLYELKFFRDAVNAGNTYQGKYVKLTANINLAEGQNRGAEESNWTPIGNSTNKFQGTFDGQNHTISNLKIYDVELEYAGFFGYTTNATIKNVKVHNVDINAYSHVGAIAGIVYTGNVDNCHVSGTINLVSQYAYAAGITGYGYVTVKNSSVIAEGTGIIKVVEKTGAGGITGWRGEGNTGIYNCTVKNLNITAWSNVGGITGFLHYENTIDNCVVDNVNLYKTREDGQASIGLAAGGWAAKADNVYTITVKNTNFSNMSINGTAINSFKQNGERLIGSNYSYYINIPAEKLVVEENVFGENITDNLSIVVKSEAHLGYALASDEGEVINIGNDIVLEEVDEDGVLVGLKIEGNRIIDLNGFTISGTDNATGSFGLINIQPNAELTINDSSEPSTGKITLTATNNREWNAYSSVISNQRGKLTVNGGTIEHLGGTDMAYGIDNLTNGKGTYAETVINGGYIKSTYRGIRQFLNGIEAQNILTVNGGTIEGANKSIWMQDPSKNANTGTLTVDGDATLKGDVYLFVTKGSTEWPVEVSIAAAALAEGSDVISANVPAGYEVKEMNDVYGVYHGVAKINNVLYESLAEAATAAQNGETIELLWQEGQAPIAMNATFVGNKTVTITGTANVDWSKDFFFVGRNGEGDGKVIFDDANLTSVSNSNAYGFNVSGSKVDDNTTNNGIVEIKNSTIVLDYMLNKNVITLDNSTLTVKNGFSVTGRKASESATGEDATATMTLSNNSKVVVNNMNGMGIGHEAYGIMNIDATSTFETTQNFLITAKGTMNVNGGNVKTVGTLTNNGTINVTGESTLNIEKLEGSSIDLNEGAIVKNSTVGGDAYIAGNVTFRGDNTFAMISDYGDYYSQETPSMWTVEAGASLTLTKTDRYGLGYGDKVTVYGEIEDEKALTARASLTDEDASVNMYGGLVGMTNSAAPNAENSFTATNAYLIFGVNGDKSFGNKSGDDYYGNYIFNFENSVVTANGFKFYEDNGTSTVKFSDSDLLVNGVLMTNDASSSFTFENSVVRSNAQSNGTDDKNQNAGVMTLTNTQFTYSAAFTNVGTLNLDLSSKLTAPSVAGDGIINIDATNFDGNDIRVISADMASFEGVINVEGAHYIKKNDGIYVTNTLQGSLTKAYTSATGYWGECGGNANESFVLKFYNDNTYMGQTSLNDIDNIIDGDVYVTWSIDLNIDPNAEGYWAMSWDIRPTLAMQPNRVEQWIDGVKVAECAVEPNWADNIFPVVAAVTGENDVILSYVNNTTGATLKDAFAAGGNIAILRDFNLAESVTVPADKTVVLNLNGKTMSQTKACTASYEMINNKGNLTIKGNGKISFKDTSAGDPNFGWGSYTVRNEGTLVVENGTIEHLGEQDFATHCIMAIFQYSGSSTINGGKISTPAYRSARLWKGDMTINGGTFDGQLWVQSVDNTAKLTINGGNFSPNGNDASSVFVGNTNYDAAFTVTGGTFETKIGCNGADNLTGDRIIGGLFTQSAVDNTSTDLLGEGFVFNGTPNANGYYTVIQVAGTQTRELVAGWSWFSTYIKQGNDGLSLLQDSLNPNGVEIKSREGFTRYYPGLNDWSPSQTLTSVSTTKMYMIKTSAAHTLELEGSFEDENVEITIAPGWNWIGYPVHEEISFKDALANWTPENGDSFKSKDKTVVYMWGNWQGDFNMVPGEGYMYSSKANDPKILSYSTEVTGTSKSNSTKENDHWIADIAKYPSNMTVIAMLSIDNEIVDGDYEIAAFANGECRGSARPIYVEAIDAYVLLLTIQGEEVENLTFKYYDVNYGTEYELNNTMVYSNDAIVGTMEEPYMFNLGILNIDESSVENISIYPNPTTTGKEINLQAVCDKVEVFNALGVKVAEYTNVDSIDAIETAGIYVIRVTIDGNARNCRLIVK